MPKQPKRAIKIIKSLLEVKEILIYFIGNEKFKEVWKSSFDDIESYIQELSENRKDHDRRLWNKFKNIAGIDENNKKDS